MPRKGKAPAFQFYPADFLADEAVAIMSLAERGAYITLLAFNWREGSIPSDERSLARLLGCSVLVFRQVWKGVGPCFQNHPNLPGRLQNPRLAAANLELESYRQLQATRGAQGGRKSAKLRREIQALVKRNPTSAVCSLQSASTEEIQDSGEGPQTAPPVDNSPPERDVSALLAGMGAELGMEPIRAVRTPEDQRLAQAATKLIDRIRYLERDQNGDAFDPGGWWGRTRGPAAAKFEALAQLAKLLEAGKRPNSPHGYMTRTWAEKKANFYADRAEAESEKRRKEAGARA